MEELYWEAVEENQERSEIAEQAWWDAKIAADEAQAAAAPGGTQAGPGAPAEPTEPAEGLTAPTRAEILEQQAKAEAERQRQEQGGDAPLPGKKVTGDTPDMFMEAAE